MKIINPKDTTVYPMTYQVIKAFGKQIGHRDKGCVDAKILDDKWLNDILNPDYGSMQVSVTRTHGSTQVFNFDKDASDHNPLVQGIALSMNTTGHALGVIVLCDSGRETSNNIFMFALSDLFHREKKTNTKMDYSANMGFTQNEIFFSRLAESNENMATCKRLPAGFKSLVTKLYKAVEHRVKEGCDHEVFSPQKKDYKDWSHGEQFKTIKRRFNKEVVAKVKAFNDTLTDLFTNHVYSGVMEGDDVGLYLSRELFRDPSGMQKLFRHHESVEGTNFESDLSELEEDVATFSKFKGGHRIHVWDIDGTEKVAHYVADRNHTYYQDDGSRGDAMRTLYPDYSTFEEAVDASVTDKMYILNSTMQPTDEWGITSATPYMKGVGFAYQKDPTKSQQIVFNHGKNTTYVLDMQDEEG